MKHSDRIDKIGIKQVIRLEWMEKTLQMSLAGMSVKDIRSELTKYLQNKKQSGGTGERGDVTFKMAIGPLVHSWSKPPKEISDFHKHTLEITTNLTEDERIVAHWAMLCAAYPFWFNVALQIGRLLKLQDVITKQQIIKRLIEQYGDRQTISRYTRYVIRSFVAWEVLTDTDKMGCYTAGRKIKFQKQELIITLLESGLFCSPSRKELLSDLLNSPAFFPFQFPMISGDSIVKNNSRIEVSRFALNDEIIKLKL